jgi:inorganic triphosphatase YgiF
VIVSRDRAFSLRFEISAEGHDRLLAAFFTPARQDVEQDRHLSVYLDTPDAILRQEDVLWCFSRKDKMRDGRLKAGEWRLDRDRGARSFIKKHRLFNQLGGVFTLRLDHQSVVYRQEQMAVEISLEHGQIRSGDHTDAILEAKFTLRDGEAEDLVQLVSAVLPQAVPTAAPADYIERGYRLCGMGLSALSATQTETRASVLDKNMRVADAGRFILRLEIGRAMEGSFSADGASLQRNLHAVRSVSSALKLFAGVVDGNLRALSDWEAALQKLHDLDVALTAYLKPAVRRGQWEAASGLVARIEEGRTRSYAAMAQTWPSVRIKTLFSEALEKCEADVSLSVAGNESFAPFISNELSKAADEIQSRGQALCEALKQKDAGRSTAKDIRRLSECVAYIEAVTGFAEPLARGKAAKRRAEFQAALGDLKTLLDKDHYLQIAQTLVADAAAHIARLKQTRTQNAQTYAAGALAGFFEAMKAEKPEKALKKALTALSEIKPFWSKID